MLTTRPLVAGSQKALYLSKPPLSSWNFGVSICHDLLGSVDTAAT